MKNNVKFLITIALFATAFCCSGQQRYFMRIEGPNIAGRSTTAPHVNEFELETFSFGVSNSGTRHIQGGTGKPNLLPFSITLKQSRSLAIIYKKIHDGSTFIRVTITATKTFNGELKDYLVFTLQDGVMFTSMKNAATNNEDFITIPLTVFSKKLEVKHYKENSDGSRNDAFLQTKWNIVENKAF